METMMCEHEIELGWRFCPYCGRKIENQEEMDGYNSGDYPDGFNPEFYDLEEPL